MAYQSKADLADEAAELGIEVDPDWTREELIAAIEAADSDPGDERAEPEGGNLGFPGQPGEAPAS